jgi:hypothetical protein
MAATSRALSTSTVEQSINDHGITTGCSGRRTRCHVQGFRAHIADVIARYFMSGRRQIGGHGHAHISKPDESDPHAGLPLPRELPCKISGCGAFDQSCQQGRKN